MAALAHTYRYAGASALQDGPHPRLTLATGHGEQHPLFFDGRVLAPQRTAQALTALHRVVAARYFVPANTLARTIALADPVVTSGGGWLRFEGFSGCCSAYARVDLMPGSCSGQVLGHGTTHVDFNAAMRAALARVRDAAGLELAVGREALRLRSGEDEVTERRVALPQRWLRGFVEVQSWLSAMTPRLRCSGAYLLRWLRAAPRVSTHHTALWLQRGTRGLFSSSQPADDAVRISELQRLRVLEALLPAASEVQAFTDAGQQASAWVLQLGALRFTLALTAEPWRGFSGEGQALRALMQQANAATGSDLATLRAALHWQSRLDIGSLAASSHRTPAQVDEGLRVLGASGLVGFDVAEGAYFHRELPFDLSMLADMHPRLADAQALLAAGAVNVTAASPFAASVHSGEVEHQVREVAGELQCTCPWFARHGDERGPCKHVLAAETLRRPSAP